MTISNDFTESAWGQKQRWRKRGPEIHQKLIADDLLLDSKEAHYPGKRPQTVWGKCISMLMMMVRMMIGHEQVSAIVV